MVSSIGPHVGRRHQRGLQQRTADRVREPLADRRHRVSSPHSGSPSTSSDTDPRMSRDEAPTSITNSPPSTTHRRRPGVPVGQVATGQLERDRAGLARAPATTLSNALSSRVGPQHGGLGVADVHLHHLGARRRTRCSDRDGHRHARRPRWRSRRRTRTSCTTARARTGTPRPSRACRTSGSPPARPRRSGRCPTSPGKLPNAGVSSSRCGIVSVSLPDGLRMPSSRSATADRPPGRPATSRGPPAPASCQPVTATAEPLASTTTTRGFTVATARSDGDLVVGQPEAGTVVALGLVGTRQAEEHDDGLRVAGHLDRLGQELLVVAGRSARDGEAGRERDADARSASSASSSRVGFTCDEPAPW